MDINEATRKKVWHHKELDRRAGGDRRFGPMIRKPDGTLIRTFNLLLPSEELPKNLEQRMNERRIAAKDRRAG